jgi:hypothetical protein
MRFLVPIVPIFILVTMGSLECFFFMLPRMHKRWSYFVLSALAIILLLGVTVGVLKRGPLPINQEQRDNYLAGRSGSYQAYKLLNELHGNNYTLYALFNVNMAYFTN